MNRRKSMVSIWYNVDTESLDNYILPKELVKCLYG